MPVDRTRGVPHARACAWRVFLTCWIVYTVFWTPYLIREHFPAMTLAESGTLNVERYLGWSDDIFRGPNGGAWINNNPGASLTGAIPLIVLRPVLTRVNAWNRSLPRNAPPHNDGDLFWRSMAAGRAFYFLLVEFITVAFTMAPITAATAAYLCARLIDGGIPPANAATVSVLVGLGTPVLFRAAHLNHNLLVCDAGFAALLLLWNPHGRPLHRARAAGAGLLAGYCLLCDFSGAVVIAVAALYVWLRGRDSSDNWRTLAAYAIGVLPSVLGLMLYQAWAFGSFYHPSQQYMPPTAPTSQGYRGFDWPSLALMWANFFDPRFGLFAWCPALALAFAAPFATRVRYRVPNRETWILLTYFGLFVLFCAANRYSWLQPLTGFRYLVPVVPPLALLAIQAAQALPRALRWLIAIAASVQSFILGAAHINDVRLAAGTLWQRHFMLFWMIRLRDAGVHVSWIWTPIVYFAVALAVLLLWWPSRQTARRKLVIG